MLFLFSNAKHSGNGIDFDDLSPKDEVINGIVGLIEFNHGIDHTGTISKLYHPEELKFYKHETAKLIADHKFKWKF